MNTTETPAETKPAELETLRDAVAEANGTPRDEIKESDWPMIPDSDFENYVREFAMECATNGETLESVILRMTEALIAQGRSPAQSAQ